MLLDERIAARHYRARWAMIWLEDNFEPGSISTTSLSRDTLHASESHSKS